MIKIIILSPFITILYFIYFHKDIETEEEMNDFQRNLLDMFINMERGMYDD